MTWRIGWLDTVKIMKTVALTKFVENKAILHAPIPFGLDDGEYMITIEPKKKKRSLDQNAYFWKLLGEISKKENGDLRDVETIYTNLLEMAGSKYTSMIIKHEALDDLRKQIRHVKVIKQQTVKNVLYDTVYAFYGSSTFNTSEMSQLIDVALRYAEEVGVEDVENYWKGILNDN